MMSSAPASPGSASPWEMAPPCAAALAEKVAALADPAIYPEATGAVECIETHMSWVFLTDRYAYKLKKPIRAPFLDFRQAVRRHACCESEVELNRRLAPAVYLEVVPLCRGDDGALCIGGAGAVVDSLVKMLRLPRTRMLDTALANGTLLPFDIDAVVDTLVCFYRAARKVEIEPFAYRDHFIVEIVRNEHVLMEGRYGLPPALVKAIGAAQRRFVEEDALPERARAGRIVDGHGDLRPEHVYLGPPVQIIDCLEFDHRLRQLDPADEVAFLAMECARLQAPEIGAALLSRYCQEMRDPAPPALLQFYRCFRACVRAKLAIWHIDDPLVRDHAAWHERALHYLLIAQRAAQEF